MDQITLTRPDDWHIHLRDGSYLKQTVADASRVFGKVLAMPNLDPPIINSLIASQYKDKIMPFARTGFYPLFALYLTEKTTPQEIEQTKIDSAFVPAYKLYPAGATTNSKFGISSIEKILRLGRKGYRSHSIWLLTADTIVTIQELKGMWVKQVSLLTL